MNKCVRALLCLYLTLIIAMDAVKAQTLKVGDTLPPELWSMPLQVINHPQGKETLTLSEYKDKLIILDFWATWCAPCIAMLPKQDSLQKQFKDQIQILPVTYQTEREVGTFMEKYEKRKGIHIDLPKVVENTRLKELFNRGDIPFYVWIDKSKIVRAITSSDKMKEEILVDFLQRGLVPEDDKRPKTVRYNSRYPLLLENEVDGYPISHTYQSALINYIPGLTGGHQRYPEGSYHTRITMMNQPLPRLAAQAYGEGRIWFGNNRIKIETPDSTRLVIHGNKQLWMKENAYSYEIIVPEKDSLRIFELMRQDLKRYFPEYRISVQERIVLCYALTVTDFGAIPHNKDGQSPVYNEQMLGLNMRNCHPAVFVDRLNFMYQQHSPYPLVDNTGIATGIDLIIEANLSDIHSINAALSDKGLVLLEELRPIKLLIIEDAKSSVIP